MFRFTFFVRHQYSLLLCNIKYVGYNQIIKQYKNVLKYITKVIIHMTI